MHVDVLLSSVFTAGSPGSNVLPKNGVVQARQPAWVNLLQRATTGRIWPRQDCWTAFVDEARAVRRMDWNVRVIKNEAVTTCTKQVARQELF
jgi:hypothetical protein